MKPPRRVDLSFVLASPWNLLATGFGSGLSPWAPGTAGSLFGWAAWVLLQPWLPTPAWPPLLLIAFALGVVACGRAAAALQVDDPSALVWDEVVGIWLVLCLLPTPPQTLPPLWLQVAGFALFRVFDAVKRGPVGWADRHLKGGLGIMVDDIVAALLAAAVLRGALWLGAGHGL